MFGFLKSRAGRSASAGTVFGPARFSLPSGPKLLLLTDALIAALALVLPFIMGGREAWGHRFVITLALALGCVWCLHRVRTGGRLVLTAVEPLVAAGLLLVWFQTWPLPESTLAQLSGEYSRLLPDWSETQPVAKDAQAVSRWTTASLIPSETRHGFWMLLAYGLIGVVVVQRLETEADCHRLLKLIGISGILMAVFAVVQLVTSNDRFFWFYRQPYTGTREILKGAFTNRNHFAQFLALSVGPLVWWMLVGRVRKSAPSVLDRKGLGPAQGNHSRFDELIDPVILILLCAVGGVITCVMLSLSRGGMVATGVASTVTLAGLWRSGRVRASLALVMLAMGVIVIGGLIVFGQDRVEDRVGQLATGDADRIDQSNARRMIWKADMKAIRAFPLVGTGVGSHRYVYPIYMEELADFHGISFSHAESSYVHLALEAGIAGLSLLALGLVAVLGRMIWHLIRRQDAARTAALAAVIAGLLAGSLHAAADFIWYAPAIVVTTILLLATGLRLCSGFLPEQGVFLPRAAWLAGSLVCLLLLCRTQPDLAARVSGERAWYAYLNAQFDAERSSTDRVSSDGESSQETSDDPSDEDSSALADTAPEMSPAAAAEPGGTGTASYSTAQPSEDYEDQVRSLNGRLRLLMASLKAQPDQPLAAIHLAGRSLDLFQLLQRRSDNRLDLVNIRDAVLSSQFSTVTDMHAWLKRAFGSPIRLVLLADQSARQSLAACPVQHEAYEILVTTGFVRDPGDRRRGKMLQEAIQLGQYSPSVRFAAGIALLTDGRHAEAVEQWAGVFHSTDRIREMFCSRIGKSTSVEFLLREFDPSVDELDEVLRVYAGFQRKQDIDKLLFTIAEKTRPTGFDASRPVSLPSDSNRRDREREADDNVLISSEAVDRHALEDSSGGVTMTDSGGDQRVSLLLDAARVADQYGDAVRGEELLKIAIARDSEAYWPRHALASLYYRHNRFQEAEGLLAWCCEQEPGDTHLEDLRRECRRRANSADSRMHRASWSQP